jgi:hypothetical protein
MTTSQNATTFFGNVERALSSTRFAGYKQHGETDTEALAKYVWNTLLCESLYPGFHILEVAFRNAAHSEIASAVGDGTWLMKEPGFLFENELTAIKESKQSLVKRGTLLTEDTLTAELSFGFWTSLLDTPYHLLWHKIIIGVFPHMPKSVRTRRDAASMTNRVRKLRNAALHHHSIWHWNDLQEQHRHMRTLISYICKSSAAMAEQIDRFPKIYALGTNGCMDTARAMLAESEATSAIVS